MACSDDPTSLCDHSEITYHSYQGHLSLEGFGSISCHSDLIFSAFFKYSFNIVLDFQVLGLSITEET
jgi:hypothetical protein